MTPGSEPNGSLQAQAPQVAPSEAAPAVLPSEWQDWLTRQALQGAEGPGMLAAMCDVGFDRAYAHAAVSVVRSMVDRVRRESPQLLQKRPAPKPAAAAPAAPTYQPDPIRLPQAARTRAHDRDVAVTMAMANPNIALLDGLLSEKECDVLIELSRGKLVASHVLDPHSGAEQKQSEVRSSDGTYFRYGENAVVRLLEARLAALTGLPMSHGEPLTILRYPVGGEYIPHHDYFDPAFGGSERVLRQGGQRVATAVIYLKGAEGGGETAFPKLGLSVRPRRGGAVYFEYFNQQGQIDPRLLHAGTPVTQGEKWIATKWFRQRPYAAATA
jgi:prolyl 4-hydroxylase